MIVGGVATAGAAFLGYRWWRKRQDEEAEAAAQAALLAAQAAERSAVPPALPEPPPKNGAGGTGAAPKDAEGFIRFVLSPENCPPGSRVGRNPRTGAIICLDRRRKATKGTGRKRRVSAKRRKATKGTGRKRKSGSAGFGEEPKKGSAGSMTLGIVLGVGALLYFSSDLTAAGRA